MKSVNSNDRRAAAARLAGPRLWIVAPLCLLALALGLLAAASPRAAAAQEAGQKTKDAAESSGKGGNSVRSAQPDGSLKPSGAKTRDAVPLADQIGCATNPSPISIGGTVNGTLSSGDCRHPTDNSFYDAYTFSGTAGQLVVITLNSADFDAYLYLLRPNEATLSYRTIQNDDTPGPDNTINLNSRIVVVLPDTGTYTILANSALTSQTGAYQLRVSGGCAATPNIVSGTINGALTDGDCQLHDGTRVDVYTFTATAGQRVSITMQPRTGSATPLPDPFLFLLSTDGFTELARNDDGLTGGDDGNRSARIPAPRLGRGEGLATLPATGTYYILANAFAPEHRGDYTLTLTLDTNCPTQAITAGQSTTSQQLSTSDCRLPFDGSFMDVYTFAGTAGQQIAVTMTSTAFDSYLLLYDPDGFLLDENNDGAGGTNARIPTGSGFITLPFTGTYRIYANAAGPNLFGSYQLTVATPSNTTPNPTVAFKFATYSVSEAETSRAVIISVTRTGNTSGASTVEYRTVAETDAQAQVPCNPTQTQARGTASPRCDFATTVDTLAFGANEVEKTFTIPLVNDVHVEGAETFQIELASPTGATLGTQATATITINDNDTAPPTTNPVRPPLPYGPDTPRFFVRQHYLDFLSREPEAGEPWTNVLVNCPNPENGPQQTTTPSAGCDRLLVSRSFFESPEFALKGFFVFLYHKASFGSAQNPNFYPEYRDIVTDMRRVTGTTSAETLAKRDAFAAAWVTRPAFTARYNGTSSAEFVDTLLANVNATPTQAGSGFTRDSLVADLNAGTKTRAEVLRLIVESKEVVARQFNHAYVAMQYYGYLRRTPDLGGYLAWLAAISSGGDETANRRVMVNGFLNSTEYVFRFGPS
jgi:hypothetical protein